MTETSIQNSNDETISVRNTKKGVMIEWTTPRYEEGVLDDVDSHYIFNTGEMEQMTRSCAAAIDWLRDYDKKRIVDNCDLLLLETEAYIYLLKIREYGELFDIVQKGDFEKLEARWSIFGYDRDESGFLFDDMADTVEFMRGMADACLAYRHLLREPRARK